MMHDKRLIDANALIKGFEAAGLGDHSLSRACLLLAYMRGLKMPQPSTLCRWCMHIGKNILVRAIPVVVNVISYRTA